MQTGMDFQRTLSEHLYYPGQILQVLSSQQVLFAVLNSKWALRYHENILKIFLILMLWPFFFFASVCPSSSLASELFLKALVSPWKLLSWNFCQLGVICEPNTRNLGSHIAVLSHVLIFFQPSVHPWHFADIHWLLPRMISWTYT